MFFSNGKPYVFKTVLVIANESWYPPECVVVLSLFFLCAVVILKLIIAPCCSRAMNSNGFALPALRIRPRLQAAILNRHGFRTRLQNVAMGVSQQVSLGSLGGAKRYTHKGFHAVFVPETRSKCHVFGLGSLMACHAGPPNVACVQ